MPWHLNTELNKTQFIVAFTRLYLHPRIIFSFTKYAPKEWLGVISFCNETASLFNFQRKIIAASRYFFVKANRQIAYTQFSCEKCQPARNAAAAPYLPCAPCTALLGSIPPPDGGHRYRSCVPSMRRWFRLPLRNYCAEIGNFQYHLIFTFQGLWLDQINIVSFLEDLE